jgi:hypothetical protein
MWHNCTHVESETCIEELKELWMRGTPRDKNHTVLLLHFQTELLIERGLFLPLLWESVSFMYCCYPKFAFYISHILRFSEALFIYSLIFRSIEKSAETVRR